MKPPIVFVPKCIKVTVQKLIDVYRELDGSELALQLVGLDVGEEYDMGKGYIVKPFRTYHVVPSQGYVIYSVKKKLKPEYKHLPSPEIKVLRLAGVEISSWMKLIKRPLKRSCSLWRQRLLMTQSLWSMRRITAMFICMRLQHWLINSRIGTSFSFTSRPTLKQRKLRGQWTIYQKHSRDELLHC